jgi:hypothetical protein
MLKLAALAHSDGDATGMCKWLECAAVNGHGPAMDALAEIAEAMGDELEAERWREGSPK